MSTRNLVAVILGVIAVAVIAGLVVITVAGVDLPGERAGNVVALIVAGLLVLAGVALVASERKDTAP